MADVEKLVFARFSALYGDPKHTSNLGAFFAEYERALEGYSDEILAAAVETVIGEHTFTTWPTIGKLKQAIKKSLPAPPPPSTFRPDPEVDLPSPIAKENVRRIVEEAKAEMSMRQASQTPAERIRSYPNATDWQRMVEETPNAELHGLTERSRRMMGDD